MEPISQSEEKILEEKYQASLIGEVTINTPEIGREVVFTVLQANVTKKIALLLNRKGLIEFDLISGEKTPWIREWGLIKNSQILLIGNGVSSSLVLHGFDGSRITHKVSPGKGATEIIRAIPGEFIKRDEANPVLVNPKIISLSAIPQYGPDQ